MSIKRCYVVGAGGAGREILSWALHVPQTEWRMQGFLDANPDAITPGAFPYRVLGDPATWVPAEDEVFIAGLGVPEVRLRVCQALQARGARFITVIHPSVIRGIGAETGEGCV